MAQIARLSGSAGAKIVSLLMARQGHLEDTESPRALGRSRGDPGRIPAAVRLFYVIMADLRQPGVPGPQDDELMAIPRLAEAIGVTPRVLRYWEEQGLISPTREHGKLRYSPRDMAIARLTKRLLDAGMSVDGLGMIKELAQREIRWAAAAAADKVLSEQALRQAGRRFRGHRHAACVRSDVAAAAGLVSRGHSLQVSLRGRIAAHHVHARCGAQDTRPRRTSRSRDRGNAAGLRPDDPRALRPLAVSRPGRPRHGRRASCRDRRRSGGRPG